jgi:hypothetical protein
MYEVYLFVEDDGHETFLSALIKRVAKEYNIDVSIKPSSVRGGHGKVISELKDFLQDLENGIVHLPDLFVIATDANCKGILERRKEIDKVVKDVKELVVCAIPDPHIERWLLFDSAAFKDVFGKGCQAPDYKCDRDRYKHVLCQAIKDTGISPPLGGMEYAEDIVNAMDMEKMKLMDDLGAFLNELHAKFKAWTRN